MLAPFTIGTEEELRSHLCTWFDRVDVQTHGGATRFASLEAWMYTDIRGWTLSDLIDDAGFEHLLAAARPALRVCRPGRAGCVPCARTDRGGDRSLSA